MRAYLARPAPRGVCSAKSMALKWGICSAGSIANDFAVALKTLPETEHQVVAVAARSLESASKFAETHSIPRHYGSYQQLADDKEVCRSILTATWMEGCPAVRFSSRSY